MEAQVDILETLDISSSLETEQDRRSIVELYLTELKDGTSELKDGTSGQRIDELHRAVKSSISILKTGWPDLTRTRARELLIDTHPEHTKTDLEHAIDIALRMWLMVDSRDDSMTGYPRRWAESETVEDLVRGRFRETLPHEMPEFHHFPSRFRAVELERISGIVIQWTTFLDEHLRFDDDNRTLKIFNNKAWLLAVLSKDTSAKLQANLMCCPNGPTKGVEAGLPRDLIVETIKTLDVLFPPWHDRTVKFLVGHSQDFHLLPPVPRDLPRFREFKYWREQMTDVIVEFQAPPRDWRHVWRDRRYPMAFWTFWLGLSIFFMTLLFGFVGTLIAGLELRAAVEQVRLTIPS